MRCSRRCRPCIRARIRLRSEHTTYPSQVYGSAPTSADSSDSRIATSSSAASGGTITSSASRPASEPLSQPSAEWSLGEAARISPSPSVSRVASRLSSTSRTCTWRMAVSRAESPPGADAAPPTGSDSSRRSAEAPWARSVRPVVRGPVARSAAGAPDVHPSDSCGELGLYMSPGSADPTPSEASLTRSSRPVRPSSRRVRAVPRSRPGSARGWGHPASENLPVERPAPGSASPSSSSSSSRWADGCVRTR